MCGIVGWVHAGQTAGMRDRMTAAAEALRRRGPDVRHTWADDWLALGHARLSILDLSEAAHQPLADPTGRYRLVYNGEVFNYTHLRCHLQELGVRFTTTSDSEVVLQALIHWGTAALSRFVGFWAFGFYDSQQRSLLLARDRYGIKPLLWAQTGPNQWVFASELKALLPLGIVPRLNAAVLPAYLQLNYVPPAQSLVQGIHKLAPGHWLKLTAQNEPQAGCYYDLERPELRPEGPNPASLTYEQAQTELMARLDEAVRLRLASDVPLGVFLSGGIDSSVVASLAARHHPRIETYSLGFENPLYDETRYARAVSARIGSRHTVFTLAPDAYVDAIDPVLDYMDEPFADSSALNMFVLARETRRHVTVALSGDGADEVFGGYSKHQGEAAAQSLAYLRPLFALAGPVARLLPANRNSRWGRKLWQVQKYLQGAALSPPERYMQWCRVLPPQVAAQLLLVQHPQPDVAEWTAPLQRQPGMNGVLLADQRLVLPGDMLVKVDWMSMANSLEVRVPFLDHRVVDFANQLPAEWKVTRHQRKRILQDAARPLLPPELYHRPKQGFEVPLRDLLLTVLRSRVNDLLLDADRLQAQGIFRPQAIARLWQRVLQGTNGKEEHSLWALLVFQHWYNRYLHPASDSPA